MADTMTPEQRHRCMSHIRSEDTKPEWRVRRMVFSMGFRYRLHDKRLPGKPDLVFPRFRKVIFVHGCFWHAHGCSPQGKKLPKKNRAFWKKKFKRNQERDRQVLAALWKLGWTPLVIWECQTKDPGRLREILSDFLLASEPAPLRPYEEVGAEADPDLMAAEPGEDYE